MPRCREGRVKTPVPSELLKVSSGFSGQRLGPLGLSRWCWRTLGCRFATRAPQGLQIASNVLRSWRSGCAFDLQCNVAGDDSPRESTEGPSVGKTSPKSTGGRGSQGLPPARHVFLIAGTNPLPRPREVFPDGKSCGYAILSDGIRGKTPSSGGASAWERKGTFERSRSTSMA